LSDALERVLRAGRHDLNARFAECRRRYPELDADAFSAFLRESVDCVAGAVDVEAPARAAEVADVAFDLALELVGQRLAGRGAATSCVDDVWQRVLAEAPAAVASSPRRVLAALSNGAHQVAATAGAKAGQWVDDLARLAPCCPDAETLLRVGQVAAWRAGMAHYRAGALTAAASLPDSLALAAVGAPPSARWSEVQAALSASPWFDPAHPTTNGPRAPSAVAAAGAFRGFGGHFAEPPLVTADGEHFHVLSEEERWLLTADRFGATFHRTTPEEASRSRDSTLPSELRFDGQTVKWKGAAVKLAARGEVTSAASTATTLAITWSLTHQVTLVALA
jgi:hypothetical protein